MTPSDDTDIYAFLTERSWPTDLSYTRFILVGPVVLVRDYTLLAWFVNSLPCNQKLLCNEEFLYIVYQLNASKTVRAYEQIADRTSCVLSRVSHALETLLSSA